MGVTVTESDLDFQELRIAPVMTGGTSLAVWMGGVTAELYNLLSGRPSKGVNDRSTPKPAVEPSTVQVYAELCKLTRTTARVDVITGTSAGGLNGTLLAAAWRLQLSPGQFMTIRETWRDIAELKKLMRSPRDTNPPSLLKGDQYFRKEIQTVLEKWRTVGQSPTNPADRPVDLLVTVTTVAAVPLQRKDDFGEVIGEVNHAHRLRFDQHTLSKTVTDWPQKLAIAARTSACIPGVFEPSFLPTDAGDAQRSGLANFKEHASFAKSQYAVDGGVVNNLPLGEALERIFYMPADRQVRRLMLYVSPTPSAAASEVASVYDEAPSLKSSLLTVISAPRTEGIAGDLDQLHRYNASVDAQATARRSLIKIVGPDKLVEKANSCISDYGDVRTKSSVATTIASIVRELQSTRIDITGLERSLYTERRKLVPRSVGDLAVEPPAGEKWTWGIAPVEHAASIVASLLRRTLSLPTEAVAAADRTTMLDLWDQLTVQLQQVHEIRDKDRRYWNAQLNALPVSAGDPGPDADAAIAAWALEGYRRWGEAAGVATDAINAAAVHGGFEQLQQTFTAIVDVLCKAAPAIRRACTTTPWPSTSSLRIDLLAELEALAPDGVTPHQAGVRMRALHVLQSVMLGDIVSREQHVELMQVSWNAPNYLVDRDADQKLAGPELARLGAFLKRSWRANDWFWGRMDGAARLAEALLDPRRLRQIGCTSTDVITCLRDAIGCPVDAALTQELAVLDAAPDVSPPTRLPLTIRAVAGHLQLLIAREEIPHVLAAMKYSRDEEHSNEGDGEFEAACKQARSPTDGFAKLDATAAGAVLDKLHVGEETVGSEFGYGLMNRTISQLSSVAVNMLSSDGVGLPLLPRLLKRLRTPLQAVNSMVFAATTSSPLGKVVNAVLFAFCGAIVAVRLTGTPVPIGVLLASELLLAGAFIVAMFRTRVYWQALWVVPFALLVALSLAGNELEQVVYSDGAASPVVGNVRAETVLTFGADGQVRLTPAPADGKPLDVANRTLIIESGSGAGVASAALPAGSVLDLGDDGSFTVDGLDGELPAEKIELLGAASVTGPPAHPTGWKSWGFTRAFAVANVLLLALVMWFIGVVGIKRLATPWQRAIVFVPVLAGLIVLMWMSGYPGNAWHDLMTGTPRSDGAKHWFVSTADDLHGYRLEIVLLVLVIAAMFVGSAWDLTIRRSWRRFRRRSARS